MSLFEIKMPKLGESITEGTIVAWKVKAGDLIREDDVLFEVNTAKVSAEIPSPVGGRVVEILANEGDTIPIGVVVAKIDLSGEAVAETPKPAETAQQTAAPQPAEAPRQTATPQPAEAPQQAAPPQPAAAPEQTEAPPRSEARWYSPVVLRLAQEARITQAELDALQGTGFEGRLSKRDIQRYIERKEQGTATPTASPTPVASPPSAATVPSAAAVAPTPSPTTPVASPAAVDPSDGVEVRDMDYVRRLIADHMVMSKRVSPHVTSVTEVDVTRLAHWRDREKEAFARREGVKLTYMPAVTEAVAQALRAFPQVNVSVDGYKVLYKKHINMGIAVALDDGNLIVPVIHDADRMNLTGLAIAIHSLSAKARSNKLSPTDIDGGTFTITNIGSAGTLFGAPIINQPQAAILGVGIVQKRPAVVETPEGDTIAIRHKMYLSLSYDHRVIDGMLAGRFMRFIADYLEKWNP